MQEKKEDPPRISITVEHVRGARGLLNWTLAELAEKSGVTVDTITKWENRKHKPRESTRRAVQSAFERAGVRFSNGRNPGVKLYRDSDGGKE